MCMIYVNEMCSYFFPMLVSESSMTMVKNVVAKPQN